MEMTRLSLDFVDLLHVAATVPKIVMADDLIRLLNKIFIFGMPEM